TLLKASRQCQATLQDTKQKDRLQDLAKRLEALKQDDPGFKEQLQELRNEMIRIPGFALVWERILDEELGIPEKLPDHPPLSAKQLAELIKQTFHKKLNEKYPIALLQRIRRRAEKAYPLFKVGDYVKVNVNGRDVSGRLNQLNDSVAMIGQVMIPIQDLDPRFQPERTRQLREQYIRKYFWKPREAFQKQQLPVLRRKMAREHLFLIIEDQYIPMQTWRKQLRAELLAIQKTPSPSLVEKLKLPAVTSSLPSYLFIALGALAGISIIVLILHFSRSR
ncbi:MAG: hypothetical protein D6820_10995, partial [Lentisphaerae bacterium]